jgi:uncharacterized repeat protein (TIGR04076 family)
MRESNTVHPPAEARKARVVITRAFGTCPVGYEEGDALTVDLNATEESLRCPGVQEALAPFIEVATRSNTPDPLQFVASCHCPQSKAEVVFHLRVSPPLPD